MTMICTLFTETHLINNSAILFYIIFCYFENSIPPKLCSLQQLPVSLPTLSNLSLFLSHTNSACILFTTLPKKLNHLKKKRKVSPKQAMRKIKTAIQVIAHVVDI